MKTTTQLTSIALLTALSCSVASAATVTFVGGVGPVDDYNVAGHWEDDVGGALGRVADINDDATATGRFNINDTFSYALNSLTVNGGGSFIGNGSLTVTNDVVINSGIGVQGSGNLQWGGLATIGDGTTGTDTLSVITQSSVAGSDLDVAANGKIQLRWFDARAEGSIVPEIDLSGALDFAAGSIFEVNLEGGSTGNALTEGTYFLIGSTNITGSATLSLIDFEADQAANSFLSIDTTNADVNLQGLYLNVIPEPGTYALLAGCFALASVMIRRRR